MGSCLCCDESSFFRKIISPTAKKQNNNLCVNKKEEISTEEDIIPEIYAAPPVTMDICPNQNNYVSTPREIRQEDIDILKKSNAAKPLRQLHGYYAAKLYGITDGDTIHAMVIFMGQPRHVKIRLAGIDTPEKNNESTKIMGEKATEEVYKFFGAYNLLEEYQNMKNKKSTCIRMSETWYKKFSAANIMFTLNFQISKTISDGDARGRMLAKVIFNGKDLSDHLVDVKLANKYFGGTKNQTNFTF